jgi:hypothetical protein
MKELMEFGRNIRVRKRGKIEKRRSYSFALLKQQVMIDLTASDGESSTSVGVETPTILFPFLNCFTDILVVTNLHAFPFFQLNITLYILGTFLLKLLMQLQMHA